MKSFKNPDDASDFAVSSMLFASLNCSVFLRSRECQTSTFFSVNSLRMVAFLDQYSGRCLHWYAQSLKKDNVDLSVSPFPTNKNDGHLCHNFLIKL